MQSQIRSWLGCLLLFVCGLVPTTAYAAKMPAQFTVTFHCATSDGSDVFSGEKISVYNVANADGDAVDLFSGASVSNDETVYAQSLAKSAAGKTPDVVLASDDAGDATVTLDSGVYLVVGEDVKRDSVIYGAVPFVLDLTDGNLLPTLTSYVKYTSTSAPVQTDHKDKATLQTGVASAAFAVAALSLAAALALTAMVVRARQTFEDTDEVG